MVRVFGAVAVTPTTMCGQVASLGRGGNCGNAICVSFAAKCGKSYSHINESHQRQAANGRGEGVRARRSLACMQVGGHTYGEKVGRHYEVPVCLGPRRSGCLDRRLVFDESPLTL